MKELIIKIKYGGLGDHLLFSPVPRIAKDNGYDKVLISYHSEYRYVDTKRFVWEMNPFVDGFSNEDRDYPFFGGIEEGMNILDKVMLFFGLDDGKRFREPEVYYKPNMLPEYCHSVLYDPNFGTPVGHPSRDSVVEYFKNNHIHVTHQLRPREYSKTNDCCDFICTKDVFHFADILYSCKKIYCLTTGTATLAAALGKSVTVLYTSAINTMFHHSRLHTYHLLS